MQVVAKKIAPTIRNAGECARKFSQAHPRLTWLATPVLALEAASSWIVGPRRETGPGSAASLARVGLRCHLLGASLSVLSTVAALIASAHFVSIEMLGSDARTYYLQYGYLYEPNQAAANFLALQAAIWIATRCAPLLINRAYSPSSVRPLQMRPRFGVALVCVSVLLPATGILASTIRAHDTNAFGCYETHAAAGYRAQVAKTPGLTLQGMIDRREVRDGITVWDEAFESKRYVPSDSFSAWRVVGVRGGSDSTGGRIAQLTYITLACVNQLAFQSLCLWLLLCLVLSLPRHLRRIYLAASELLVSARGLDIDPQDPQRFREWLEPPDSDTEVVRLGDAEGQYGLRATWRLVFLTELAFGMAVCLFLTARYNNLAKGSYVSGVAGFQWAAHVAAPLLLLGPFLSLFFIAHRLRRARGIVLSKIDATASSPDHLRAWEGIRSRVAKQRFPPSVKAATALGLVTLAWGVTTVLIDGVLRSMETSFGAPLARWFRQL